MTYERNEQEPDEDRRCYMFFRNRRRKRKAGPVPVYLNVYDLTPMNDYAYWFGLGIYHSGVQIHEVEYAFGAHQHSTSGIFEVEPKHCPGFTFRKSILIGRIDLGPSQVHCFMEKLGEDYNGNSYNLITKNCNHFCDDVCMKLTRSSIPKWVNRLALLGLICNCVLPASFNETNIRPVRNHEGTSIESKKLRSRSSRFSSYNSPHSTTTGKNDRQQDQHSSSPPRSASPSMTNV